jgi:hypothetical protein
VFGIFPERLYACIMQKMPAGDGAYSRTGKRTKRFVVDLYDRKLGKGSANRKWKGMNGKGGFDANFWKELGIVYANDDGIRDAWLDKFALTLGVRHKNVTSIKSQIQTTMVGGIRCLCIVHFLVLLSHAESSRNDSSRCFPSTASTVFLYIFGCSPERRMVVNSTQPVIVLDVFAWF